MPEYSRVRDKDYMNERVRGTGGLPNSRTTAAFMVLAMVQFLAARLWMVWGRAQVARPQGPT